MLRKAGISADMAFRGNARRRVELAKKSGAAAVLFIRRAGEDAYGPYGRLHLTHLRGSDNEQYDLMTRVHLPLYREFGGLEAAVLQEVINKRLHLLSVASDPLQKFLALRLRERR